MKQAATLSLEPPPLRRRVGGAAQRAEEQQVVGVQLVVFRSPSTGRTPAAPRRLVVRRQREGAARVAVDKRHHFAETLGVLIFSLEGDISFEWHDRFVFEAESTTLRDIAGNLLAEEIAA